MKFFKRVGHYLIPSRHNAYRPHLLRKGVLMALLLVMLVAEGSLIFSLVSRNAGGLGAAVVQSQIISLTNEKRTENHLGTLVENKLLTQSAQAKANDMAAKSYFAHKGPDGKDPWSWIEASGYDYQYAGENLAVRFVDSKDVIEAWMASPTHRANMVKSSYTEIGVGIAQGVYKGETVTFVVQHLGRPAHGTTNTQPVASGRVAPIQGEAIVLGAETEQPVSAPPASFGDSLARQLGKIVAEPRASTMWLFGGIAGLVALALAFAFFHHIQIQSRDLLLPGTVVVGLALGFMYLNTQVLTVSFESTQQAAGVVLHDAGVLLTSEAAAIAR